LAERRSVPELKRQMAASLFLRLAASQDKAGILQLALLVEYATYGMSSQLFVQKYQLYLPDREALRRELEHTLREASQ
jgi:hypothetical protein